jgi:hypothetical protein
MSHGIPITYVPARNTIFLSLRWPGPKCWAAPTFSSASTRSIIRAIPIAARNTSKRTSAWPIWRPRPASKGARGSSIHTPLLAAEQGADREAGRDLGVPFGLTFSCYDPGPMAAPAGSAMPACCGARVSKRPALKIAELFYSLQGEGRAGGRAVGLHPHQRLQSALRVVRYAVHFLAAGGRRSQRWTRFWTK